MSRRLTRVWLLPMLLIAGQASALGLGDIRLSSALNEPMRAEIELLAATPEELNNLTVQLASSETFERYGLDRPLFLTRLNFDVFKTGTTSGNRISITSDGPVTEPFVTFLVEAVWSRGRLLREYTVLLDPPTFAPPPVTRTQESVTAPSRTNQSDAGRIDRSVSTPPPAAAQPAPSQPQVQVPVQSTPAQTTPVQSVPERTPQSTPAAATPQPSAGADFDTGSGGNMQVQRGDTLWGIASQVRSDPRLTMNQTMIAIYEANPQAFDGNINKLSAGASLRIPSADDIYRISRGEALSEVQRQHQEWGGDGAGYSQQQPSLKLVPPDEDQTGYEDDPASYTGDGYSREAELEERIRELEGEVPDQDALLQIRDNELAQLRAELARLRGEEPLPLPVDDEPLPADDEFADDEFADDELPDEGIADPDSDTDQIFVDDETDAAATGDDAPTETGDDVAPVTDTEPPAVTEAPQPTLIDTILAYVLSWYGAVAAAVIMVLGILVWFARRAGRDDEDSTGVWEALDADDLGDDTMASTERLSALAQEDDTSIVVVEQESKAAMAAEMAADRVEPALTAEPVDDPLSSTDTNKSLEDTFSSETAINLDQSDPIAEADFHMAYGLHDQAADLINGALEVEPERQDLLAKLCEVYFVWGNRDAFVDAAKKMKNAVGDSSSAEWDKIVIMGQQLAADHELFSGKSAGEATKAVDLSFDGALDDPGELDIDLAGGQDGAVSDVIDLGADTSSVEGGSGIDFSLDDPDTSASVTQEMPQETPVDTFGGAFDAPTIEAGLDEETAESPAVAAASDSTVESPTIEQQIDSLDATGELPSFDGGLDDDATELASLDDELPSADATAEIDLDDLGLDLDALEHTSLAADIEGGDADIIDLDATGANEALNLDDLEITGTNQELDEDDFLAAGGSDQNDALDATGRNPALDIEEALNATSEVAALSDDATGATRELNIPDESLDDGFGVDTRLLDATGQTQILSDELGVETASDVEAVISDAEQTMIAQGLSTEDTTALPEDAETLLAPLDEDDEDEFDFAKTEALPKDVFTGETSTDETGELPSLAGSTDMDLDLDDLTAALRVSEVGDTVNQMRDDATVEQPRIRPDDNLDLDVGGALVDDDVPTQALSPDEVSDDLHDARTMTEVGTKLDLARAYVDMGDPGGARSILEEVLDEGDDGQRQQAQQLLDSLPS